MRRKEVINAFINYCHTEAGNDITIDNVMLYIKQIVVFDRYYKHWVIEAQDYLFDDKPFVHIRSANTTEGICITRSNI